MRNIIKWKGLIVSPLLFWILVSEGCAVKRAARVEYIYDKECKSTLVLRCEEDKKNCRIVSFKHVEGCERMEVGR